MLFYFCFVYLFIDKVCPSGAELGVIDTSIFEFEAEVGIDSQMESVYPSTNLELVHARISRNLPFIFIHLVPAIQHVLSWLRTGGTEDRALALGRGTHS